jgi:hypothetical protein
LNGGLRLSCLLALAASAAAAQPPEAPICADRPGKATGTCTVAPGHVQAEVGLVSWSRHDDGTSRETALSLGETVVKIGVTERSNLGIGLSPYLRSTTRDGSTRETVSGFGDLQLLYKHRLTAEDAPVQVALLPAVKIPTAKRSLGNGKVEAALLLPVTYSIAHSQFSIGATPEIDWAADGDGRGHHAAMAQVLSLGWAATDRLSLSGEIWAQWDWDPAGTSKQVSADASVAYLVSEEVQLDAGANLGLTRDTPDIELYGGVSVRF